VDIRGFGDTAVSNILVLVNDRRVNAIDLSGADLLQIPLEAVERIEVIRGAGSVLYGDNAVGGIVNIVTKKGKGKMSGKLGGSYGSYNAQSGHMELSGSLQPASGHEFSYYFYSQYNDDRGYRDHSDVLSKDFNSRIVYRLWDKLTVDYNVGVHDDTYDLPGGLDESEVQSLGRRGSANQNDVATTTDKYYDIRFDLTPWPEDVYYGHFIVDYNFRDRDVFDSFSGFNTDRNIVTQGITGKYIFDRSLLGRDVDFILGVDYYMHENNILGSGFNTDDLTISKDEFAGYLFLEAETLENLFLNAGTRYHRAKYTFNQRSGAVSFTNQDPSVSVNMVGLKYAYAKGSNLHFNVQQTFRFLATDEWYSTFSGLNTDLDQQTGIQYEMGIKHNFDNKIVVHVTPYWIDNKNEIFFDPTSGFFGSNSNYDKTRRIGVEVGGRGDVLRFFDWPVFDSLEYFVNYTFQNPEFVDGDFDGKNIPLVPRHQAQTGLIAKITRDFRVSLLGRYVGRRFIINDTTNVMPPAKPYYVLDAKFSYQLKRINLFLSVNNLTNEKYASYQIKKTSTTRDIYPQPERNFTFGFDLDF